MTRSEARRLLSGLRDGSLSAGRQAIREALRATGDLAERPAPQCVRLCDDEFDDAPIVRVHRPVGAWEGRKGAVAEPFDALLEAA